MKLDAVNATAVREITNGRIQDQETKDFTSELSKSGDKRPPVNTLPVDTGMSTAGQADAAPISSMQTDFDSLVFQIPLARMDALPPPPMVMSDTTASQKGDDLSGDDAIKGGRGEDSLRGGRGDDSLQGGRNDDTLRGGRGDDTLRGGTGDDIVRGGKGDDDIQGGRGDDTVRGGRGDDTLKGGRGEDDLRGRKGDDKIRGGRNDDVMVGGKGNDSLFGGTGNDAISGGKGDDVVSGGKGDDTLIGASGNDTIRGGDGIDTAGLKGKPQDYDVSINVENGRDVWVFTNKKTGETDKLYDVERVAFGNGPRDTSGGVYNLSDLPGIIPVAAE